MPRRRDADVAVRAIDLSVARSARGAHPQRVLEGVSFVLEHGAALAVMGPTGSGKTSLLDVLSARGGPNLAVVGGEAWVEGLPVRRPGRALRTLTFVTGHLEQTAGARLPARLTVAEVIGEPLTSRTHRYDARALAVRVAGLLDELMLPLGAAAKYPYELSAGMRQRVAFARALILQPQLFLGDEPFANMDVEVRWAARDALQRRRDEYGLSTILATNDPSIVKDFGADVLVLDDGHPVGYGTRAAGMLWTPDASERRLIST